MRKDEEDRYLLACVREAQQHNDPASPGRRRALANLARVVTTSKRLYRPPRSRLPALCQGAAYADVCRDAQQELLLWVCQNIEKYDPERASVIGWLNMLLERRFLAVGIHQFRDKRLLKRGKRVLSDFDDENDNIPNPEPENPEFVEFRQWIEEDPRGLLQGRIMRDRRDINLQMILLRRLTDRTWADIAQELGLSLPTLHSFFRRSLKTLSPDLKAQFGSLDSSSNHSPKRP